MKLYVMLLFGWRGRLDMRQANSFAKFLFQIRKIRKKSKRAFIWIWNTPFHGIQVNRSISQIPQCISQISHNAPFCNRMCTHVHISVTKWCIVGYGAGAFWGFVRWVYCDEIWLYGASLLVLAPDVTPAIVFMGMFGKFSISASFAVIILYTRELFPTNLRWVMMSHAWYATKFRIAWAVTGGFPS